MGPEKVYVFDTTLRDGEQVPGCGLDKEQKVTIALALEELGVDVIEAGFPISSPGDFQSVQAVCNAVSNAVVCALTRAVEKDIECAGEALKKAKVSRIHTGIGTSTQHIVHKFKSTPEEIIERAAWCVRTAKNLVDEVEFYAEDAGRTENPYLAQVVQAVVDAGATVVNIPDTTGYCLPEEYGEKIRYLKENVKGIDSVLLACHCHNDLGLATANTIAGIQNGARQVECTINGVGERAGNTSLEEVIMILKKQKLLNAKYRTDIVTEMLCPISNLVAETMKMPVQPNKAIVGSNAFAHSSGIHQDGVLKNRLNYEIMDPSEVGVSHSSIVLTARSGRAALKFKLNNNKIEPTTQQLDEIYQRFLTVADEHKQVTESQLLKIAKAVTTPTTAHA